MNHIYLVHDIFHLICLQMADQMPSDIVRQFIIFIHQLLYPVFTEISGTGIIGLLKHWHGFCFTNGNQRYLPGISSNLHAMFLYCVLNLGNIIRNHIYPLHSVNFRTASHCQTRIRHPKLYNRIHLIHKWYWALLWHSHHSGTKY